MAHSITRANPRRVKFKGALCGPSKAGKTYVSMLLASGLASSLAANGMTSGNGRVCVIDTQNRQSEFYADEFDFDIYDLVNYSPESYIAAMNYVSGQGYEVTIVDSISHEWAGRGGLLDEKSALVRSNSRYNDFTAFGVITPRHNDFTDAIIRYPGHLISCVRAKTEWDLRRDSETGKTAPVKIGLGPVQRDGIEYDYDFFGHIAPDHSIRVESRGSLARALNDQVFAAGEVGRMIGLICDWMGRSQSLSEFAISAEQVAELRQIGDEAGMTPKSWGDLLSKLQYPSLERVDTVGYEKIRGYIAAAVARRKEKAASLSV